MNLHEITDSRPLIWRLIAQQLEKGKRVLYHAHLTGEASGYVIGMVTAVDGQRAFIRKAGVARNAPPLSIAFSKHDDTDLTLRPSNDTSVADFTIVDNNE